MSKVTLQQISQQCGFPPQSCSYAACQGMCQRSPCIGTPDDMLRLVNNGHVGKIIDVTWAGGLHYNIPPTEMFIPAKRRDGSCVFFNGGLCDLHSAGLKPSEGKLAIHLTMDDREEYFRLNKQPAFVPVALTWHLAENKRTKDLILKAFNDHAKTHSISAEAQQDRPPIILP